jgi:hypothetical protein
VALHPFQLIVEPAALAIASSGEMRFTEIGGKLAIFPDADQVK